MKTKPTAAEREAAKTASQLHAVRDLETAFACERIAEGASADWLLGYCEAIADPTTESVDDVRRLVLARYNETRAA
jgi:hypothetical protein